MQLPPGLDPVAAARFGLWLLGKRSHRAAQKRTYTAARVKGHGLAARLVRLLVPWTVDEYPGRTRAIAALCNVSHRTVEDWQYRPERLPRKQARRLAEVCDERVAAFAALRDDLLAWADRPENERARRQGIKPSDRGA
jgi:hypothetical protein